jgi:hypothetical protein
MTTRFSEEEDRPPWVIEWAVEHLVSVRALRMHWHIRSTDDVAAARIRRELDKAATEALERGRTSIFEEAQVKHHDVMADGPAVTEQFQTLWEEVFTTAPALLPEPRCLPMDPAVWFGVEQELGTADGAPICPSCGGYIPNNAQPGAYPGALSRRGDYEVCSDCGLLEALSDFTLRLQGGGDDHGRDAQ